MAFNFLSKMFTLLALLFTFTARVHSQNNIFNIRDFGAIPDGKTDNSAALLSAWSKACEIQGNSAATVLIPNGRFLVKGVIMNGGCKSRSMVFQLDGVLLAPSDAMLGSPHWITFHAIDSFTLHGKGSFDGQGSSAWSRNSCGQNPKCSYPPVSVGLESISNGLIRGISSVNSKFFHFALNNCNHLDLANLKITAPGDSQNTDGIHVARSSNIRIYNTKISTGDDCISLGPGCTNVTISGIMCGPGHGISIGSLGRYQGEENVSGITVKDCQISNTQNGLRIKTWAPSGPSIVSDITYENIILNNVSNPIIIDQQYCPYPTSCSHQGESRVQISSVRYINVRGTSWTKTAVNLQCSKSVPCKDIELDGIDINYVGINYDRRQTHAVSSCSNVYVSHQGQQIPPPCSQ